MIKVKGGAIALPTTNQLKFDVPYHGYKLAKSHEKLHPLVGGVFGHGESGMGHGEEITNAQCPKLRGGCPSPPTRGWSFPPLSIKNVFGLILGYIGAAITGQPKAICRTISIEVGMQNSGLAVALAIAHFDPVAAILGAIFSVCHNLTGSLIAAIWRKYS
ncbi:MULTISPECIES: bile acid:sodium symporter family protein [unclassified Tolypothrix]|uniref:bile acid:sodium symporter family protein n=1 Tax=unclassified Tolypothrix TaxID=2649714 RepID=UPI0005EAA92A|nr:MULTISPECIES: hypothetical protein [unclassified Tolypothrix]BAY91109.1 bile acid:Na+ symporter, BASS family protein [Microchaete diplosiphon NIES-3275]EKE99967.1 hypothetical protein FDUTEX481_09490 [Tolypothrix sp. PCC 7601]MBE9081444.1 hypothetical protein [Tolypothrix sp. LEGE 11397]UYD25206.1 hypothetical protein HGR01_28045 [Tolypothrix sp. PCC 7712]UYD32555.1 hypothetical protein HG267_26565 [Tolypothrix sp. PCC 7601]